MTTSVQYAARLAWCDRLESGADAQCRGRLYDGTGFCCLGVAEVSTGQVFSYNSEIGWAVPYGRDSLYETHVLSDITAAALGLCESPTLWTGRYAGHGLTELNDSFRLSLPEIGRQIRLQPREWDGTDRVVR